MTDIDRALKSRPGCCAPSGFIRALLWMFEPRFGRAISTETAQENPSCAERNRVPHPAQDD